MNVPPKTILVDRRSAAARVLNVILKEFNICPDDMLFPCRQASVVQARSMFVFAMHRWVGYSMSEIQKFLQAKSHTFCIDSNARVMEWIKDNKKITVNGRQVEISWLVRQLNWAAQDCLPDTIKQLAEHGSSFDMYVLRKG